MMMASKRSVHRVHGCYIDFYGSLTKVMLLSAHGLSILHTPLKHFKQDIMDRHFSHDASCFNQGDLRNISSLFLYTVKKTWIYFYRFFP